MSNVGIIVSKELRRVFQDKKLIFSLFILPAILIVGMYSLIGQLAASMMKDVEGHISRVFIQNEPEGLDSILLSSGFADIADIIYLENGEDTEGIQEQILAGDAELLVVFDEAFMEMAGAYQAAGDAIPLVRFFYNTTENYSQAAKGNFDTMVLSALQTGLLAKRLGNLELLTVFHTEQVIIADEDKANGAFLANLLPYLITFMLFAGVMGLGVDMVTGEKERGTMASMLLAPISRRELVFGKLISLSMLSGFSAGVYAIAMLIAVPMMSKGITAGEEIPVAIKFSPEQVLMLFAIMIVMVFLYAALVSLVAVYAKTAKEANTYVSPVYMIVLVAGMLTMFQGGMEKPLSHYAIPIYGNALAIQNLMTNELLLPQFCLSIGGCLVTGLILTVLLTKAFNSEKVMFNA